MFASSEMTFGWDSASASFSLFFLENPFVNAFFIEALM
jgi:hypothetical protein